VFSHPSEIFPSRPFECTYNPVRLQVRWRNHQTAFRREGSFSRTDR
jgi:hypothetical protein